MPHDAAAKKAAPSKHGNEALGHVGHSSIRRNAYCQTEHPVPSWALRRPLAREGAPPLANSRCVETFPRVAPPGDALSKMGRAMRYAIDSTDVFVDASRAGGLFGGGRADPHRRRRVGRA